MSCGLLNEQQNEILGKLTELSSAEGVLGLLDVLPFTFPTTGQGIAEAAGVGAQYGQLATKVQVVEELIADVKNGMIPDVLLDNIPAELRDGAKSLHGDVKDLINGINGETEGIVDVVLQGEALKNKVENLKTKWGGGALSTYGGIDNIASKIQSGALDLEGLCNDVDNLKKSLDGLSTIFGGDAITPPEEGPGEPEEAEEIPEIPEPVITQDTQRRIQEIYAEFTDNPEVPALYNKLEANEKTKLLQQITGALGI